MDVTTVTVAGLPIMLRETTTIKVQSGHRDNAAFEITLGQGEMINQIVSKSSHISRVDTHKSSLRVQVPHTSHRLVWLTQLWFEYLD